MKVLILISLFLSSNAFAEDHKEPCQNEKLDASCKQVCQACSSAGFVVGQAKEGNGLWVDCIKPIMQNKPMPKKGQAAGKTLPTVDATVVSQCHTANPEFGFKEHKAH